MQEKIYQCICGQEFTNPQKFNSHKSRCKVHIESKGIDYQQYLQNIHDKRSAKNAFYKQKKCEQAKLELKLESEDWISEKHRCEKCGIIMTEKFGSGRFCSRKCSNSHIKTAESKAKVSNSQKLFRINNPELIAIYDADKKLRSITRHITAELTYNLNPNICIACNNPIPYELRRRKTCCDKCFAAINGGFRDGSAKNYKFGVYKGIHCDSSYELAFLVYCLDHSIPIIRNTERFMYHTSDNKLHKYTPDFKINDTYIELKNYMTDAVKLKQEALPKDLSYKLLFGKDIQICIDYCTCKYGKNFWEILYDPDKPNCNNMRRDDN